MSGTLFFPRGGSAYVARALARGLARREGIDVSLVAGSRRDLGELSDARSFYSGIDLHEVDFTPALRTADPMAAATPLQPSYEDRPGARDRVFAALDDHAYERQVAAWADALHRAGAARADVLHLHHLTPLNAAAQRVAGAVPVVGHLHGTELLMLEAIARGAPAAWTHAQAWRRRLLGWASRCERLIVAPGNSERAAGLLDLPLKRFVSLPNGFDPLLFRRMNVDRDAIWRRVLVDEPRGWHPGGDAGSVRYDATVVDRMAGGPVLLFAGRFTEVKRLPLLLEAFAAARPRMSARATLVLVGGHPGEWEGEHPADAIARLGLTDVLLAGWHDQSELPELLAASDVLVLPSERESFGQVIVEAMACGVAPVAAASLGPAQIICDGRTGWLFGVDDHAALTDALVDAVNRPAERARRAALAEHAILERYTWQAVSGRLERVLIEAAQPGAPSPGRVPISRV